MVEHSTDDPRAKTRTTHRVIAFPEISSRLLVYRGLVLISLNDAKELPHVVPQVGLVFDIDYFFNMTYRGLILIILNESKHLPQAGLVFDYFCKYITHEGRIREFKSAIVKENF